MANYKTSLWTGAEGLRLSGIFPSITTAINSATIEFGAAQMGAGGLHALGELGPGSSRFAAPFGERLQLLIVLIFKGMQNPARGTNQTDLNLRYLRTLVMRCMKLFRTSQPL